MSRAKLQLSSVDSVSDIDTDRFLADHGAAAYNRNDEYPVMTTRAFYRDIAREQGYLQKAASSSTLVGGTDSRVGLASSSPTNSAMSGVTDEAVEEFFRYADLDADTETLVRGRLAGRSASEIARELGITKQVASRKLWAVYPVLLEYILMSKYSGMDSVYLQDVNRVLAPHKIVRQNTQTRIFVCPCGSHQHEKMETRTKAGLKVTYTCLNPACRVERTGREFHLLSQRARTQSARPPVAA